MTPPLDLDELVERFTLLPDELALLRNKTGATRLGFAMLLKHLIWKGQFPRGPSDLPDERRANQVRLELLTRWRREQIEPPATHRIDAIVGSALHLGEQVLFSRVFMRPEPP